MEKSALSYLSSSRIPASWKGPIAAIAATGLCTLIGISLRGYFDPINIVMIYLLGIVLLAMGYGRGASLWMVVLSVLSFSFFIVPPYNSFELGDLDYLFTFAVMLFTGFVIGSKTSNLAAEKAYLELKERNTTKLYALANELAYTRGRENILNVIRHHIEDVFDGLAVLWVVGVDGKLFCLTYPQLNNDPKERSAARFAYENVCLTGLGTQRLGDVQGYYIPLQASGSVLGVLGFLPKKSDLLQENEKSYLGAVANLATSVLDTVYSPLEETYHQNLCGSEYA